MHNTNIIFNPLNTSSASMFDEHYLTLVDVKPLPGALAAKLPGAS